ncbi:MAG: hypothetical protein ACXV7D_09805 [Thermoanaerobaculia bacterium]
MSVWFALALLCAAAPVFAADAPASLLDAARQNDFAAFETLFAREPSPSQTARDLRVVWTYAINDPTGAFFGTEMYDQIASAHPSFPAYIEEFAVHDSSGNRFYPTAETKRFLIEEMAMTDVDRPAARRPTPGEVAGRSTEISNETAEVATAPPQDDALSNDMAKLGNFPAPRPRPVVRAATAQIADPTENGRGIFFVILALIAAGIAIMMLRTPSERAH